MARTAQSLLSVENLCVDIPTPDGVMHPVRDVSFEVRRGETLCIVGESGSGKSMTALALLDLLPKGAFRRATSLRFNGEELKDDFGLRVAGLRGNRIAMIFQDPMTALDPVHTVGRQLTEVYRRHKGGTQAAAVDRALFLLARVGITEPERRLTQFPHELSGGLRQRVMIAMALMCGPDLLIADEPTTALDVTVQAQLLTLLADLQSELGMGMILITHDLGVVARIANNVGVMYAGKLMEKSDRTSLFEDPLHPYTQALLRCLPAGRRGKGRKLGVIPGLVPTLIGDMPGCLFRNRCAFRTERCAETDGGLGEGPHQYRCILTAERSRSNFALASAS